MDGSPRIERYASVTRFGLIVLVIPQALAGLWAFLAPRSFYDSFPGFGRIWVAPIGSYNEHFIADTGNLLLVLALLLAAAAYYLERRLVRISLALWLLFAVLHFISHVRLMSLFSTSDNLGNLGSLGFAVLLPIVLLLLTWRDTAVVGEPG